MLTKKHIKLLKAHGVSTLLFFALFIAVAIERNLTDAAIYSVGVMLFAAHFMTMYFIVNLINKKEKASKFIVALFIFTILGDLTLLYHNGIRLVLIFIVAPAFISAMILGRNFLQK